MSDFIIQDGVLTDYLGHGKVSATIPEGVTEIGGNAFFNCRFLTFVTLPESLTKIEGYAFWGCESLTSVTLPEGLQKIGLRAFRGCRGLMELALPDTVVFVGPGAFSDCKALSAVSLSAGMKTLPVNLFQGCVNLKSIRIPEGVTKIEGLAFSGCKKLEQVELPASVGKDGIWSDTFQSCPRLVLTAPHLAPEDIPNLSLPLVLGYCVNPDRYEGETAERYAEYAKSCQKEILEAAQKRTKKIKEAVMAYYGIKPAPCAPRNANARNPYAKISELKKVLLLEEAVLSGDMGKLEEVLTDCGKFEFTARALGLACRYGSLEMVQQLVKVGATFYYPYPNSALTAKYDLYTVQRGFWGSRTIYHQFWYLLTEDDLTNQDRIGDLRHIRGRLYTDGKERLPIPETERAKILRWLVPKRKAIDFDCSELLHTIVVEDRAVFADALLDEGVELKDFSLEGCPEGKEIACVRRMLEIAQGQEYKLPVNLPLLKLVMEDAKLVACLLDVGNTESLNTTEFLKSSLDAKSAGTLALCLERGFLKSKATRKKLVEQSTAAGKTEHTAVLLEYINRNTDLAKERAAEEARLMRDLTAAPDSVYMMKQFWRYKKQEDGTLIITGYIGTGTEVTVPEKIGKAAVTAVRYRAFSPKGPRLTDAQREARKTIRSVVIPDSVRELECSVFEGCVSLTSVTLPEGLERIPNYMFHDCTALTGVTIPTSVKMIGDSAFRNCTALKDVAFPSGLRKIDYQAFAYCSALTSVTLPKGIKEVHNSAFRQSGIERINYPKSLGRAQEWGLTNLREAVVEEGVEQISERMFRNCKHLIRIVLPASVKQIGYTAFDDCPDDLVICAPAGSYAEEYAKKNYYTFSSTHVPCAEDDSKNC